MPDDSFVLKGCSLNAIEFTVQSLCSGGTQVSFSKIQSIDAIDVHWIGRPTDKHSGIQVGSCQCMRQVQQLFDGVPFNLMLFVISINISSFCFKNRCYFLCMKTFYMNNVITF